MARQRNRSREVRPRTTDPARPSVVVSCEAIARRAHQRFVERGGAHGQDLEDWLAAEQELRSELAASKSASQRLDGDAE